MNNTSDGNGRKNEVIVAESSELGEGERRIVFVGNTEIGLYRNKGKLYAYENLCLHQGGPACEGLLMPKVEAVIGEDKSYKQMRFNYDEWHIVCPWHAWEYDLETGECVTQRKLRLRKFEAMERAGKIYVVGR